MLKKLIKNEYIATVRYMIPLYVILAVLTLMNKILVTIDQNKKLAKAFEGSIVYNVIAGFLLVTYILSVVAVVAFTVIFIIKRFYDNMLKDEAYLTFTLPVSTKQHLFSKIVVSYSWILLSGIVVLCSFLVMGAGFGIGEAFSEIWKGLKEVLNSGYGLEILEGVLLLLLGIYSVIIIPYTCFSVGQRMNGHPVLGAIITYIVIYVINQIIGITSIAVFASGGMDALEKMNDLQVYHFLMGYELILVGVEAIIYTIVTHYMLDKKLNLE